MEKFKCFYCNSNVGYDVFEEIFEYADENGIIKYKGKTAICKNCGEVLSIDEIEDYNQIQFENAYKEINEIITTDEIKEIMRKYDIGKRPLSKVLGLGEITITRYIGGYIPTKKNSSFLKKILKSPETYYSILMTNRSNISENAYQKSIKATNKLNNEQNIEDKVIYEVAEYITNKIDITPKALQKILYYIQLFSIKFLKVPAFSSSCKAWSHGPVFGKIYFLYKDNGYKIIKKSNKEFNIENDLLEIVDEIINNFGCYGGNVLEYFTHTEEPWKNTEINHVIEKEALKKYADFICDKYKINLISDISKYSIDMFTQYLNNI